MHIFFLYQISFIVYGPQPRLESEENFVSSGILNYVAYLEVEGVAFGIKRVLRSVRTRRARLNRGLSMVSLCCGP